MDFTTGIKLENNQIIAFVNDANVEAEYAFYLYYFPNQRTGKTLVKETKYMTQNSYGFTIEQNGYYFIKCFVRVNGEKTSKDTYTVLYLDAAFREKFNSLLQQDLRTTDTINEPIEYFKVPKPQNDFCLISEKGLPLDKKQVEEWCKTNRFAAKELEQESGWNTKNTILYDISGAQDGIRNDYIFSGYVWLDDKFYFGEDGLPNDLKAERLYENLGVFSLLHFAPHQIKLTTDYFSYGKIYYYLNENLFVAANTYHLLLIVLSQLGVSCELDDDIVYATFASNVTLFRQPITERLTVKNTFQMNLCDEIVIDNNGWNIVKRPIYDVLNGSPEFKKDEYSKLIEEAKQELISNIEVVTNNSNFEHFVLELSGGKDSRTTFAALTNLPNAREQVFLKSTDHEPNDLNVAVGLANMFQFQYDAKGDTWYQNDVLDYIRRKRSYSLGVRYLWYVGTRYNYNLKKMVFNGECFESLAVRYYSHTIKDMGLEKSTNEEPIDAYSILLSKQAIVDYSKVAPVVKEQLLEAIKSIPSSTSMEAFDNMYMFYRAGVTAGNLDRMYYTTATCMPLQSKALLKAKKMWINNFRDEKIIFDITYALNPVLAALPYNTNRYNETRKKMYDNLLFDDIRFKDCKFQLDTDKSNWEKAEQECRKQSKTIRNKSFKDRGSIPSLVFENCVLGLQRLANYQGGKFREELCLPLYYYILAEKSDDVEVRLIHNKVNSVLDCIDAISGAQRPNLPLYKRIMQKILCN